MPNELVSHSETDPTRSATHARLRWEIAIVLGLSLGASAVYSVVALVNRLSQQQAIGDQTATLNPALDSRAVFDLIYQLLAILFDLVPVALVVYLLWSVARPHLGRLGITGGRLGRDIALGALLVVVIGVPGLGIYFAGRALGLTPNIDASGLNDYWWTVPVLLLSAMRSAVQEEVIVVGYLFARLRELGWRPWTIVVTAAVLRGSYHLYQGVPAFVGNLAMGLLFGWLYTRYGRLIPLVVAHFLIDAIVFVGAPIAAGLLPALFS